MSDEVQNIDAHEQELREKVIAAIKNVFDPEIPVNIFDLGLIYDIKIFPVSNVNIVMTLTSPSCPAAGHIPADVEAKVRAVEGVNDVIVDLTFDPPYHQDMMTEAAKLELGFL